MISLWYHHPTAYIDIMVLQGRIELPTSSLPMTRSTTELLQHTGWAAFYRKKHETQGVTRPRPMLIVRGVYEQRSKPEDR